MDDTDKKNNDNEKNGSEDNLVLRLPSDGSSSESFQDNIDKINRAWQNQISQMNKHSMDAINNAMSELPKLFVPAIKIITSDDYLRPLRDSLNALANEIGETVSQACAPIIEWINSFDWSSVFQPLLNISWHNIDKVYQKFFFQKMYEAHWFPSAILHNDALLMTKDIADVLRHTRASKNRTKKIDKLIFEYYTDKKIEAMKLEWRKLGLPEYLMRLLHQSVQAYHRREYGMTVIVMVTQWEGIIYHKSNDKSWRKGAQTKENFRRLVDNGGYSDAFKTFYEDFIFYNCKSSDETIPDVPGRNSAAHSFYKEYPCRKAALNAILFTDFLLRIQPIQEVCSEDK